MPSVIDNLCLSDVIHYMYGRYTVKQSADSLGEPMSYISINTDFPEIRIDLDN